MDTRDPQPWEERLRRVAAGLPYPPTPDLAGRVTAAVARTPVRRPAPVQPRPRLALALTLLLIVVATLLLVPPVRAQILEWLQIGGVRIFLAEPTPTPTATPTPTEPGAPLILVPSTATPVPVTQAPVTATAAPTPFYNLAGAVTLEEARQQVDFEIRLPSYPTGLGEPDQAFLLDPVGEFLILVWLKPEQPSQAQLTLHMFNSRSWAGEKYRPSEVIETQVNGHPAAWTTGPYAIRLTNGDMQMEQLVEGHILVWAEDGITYRLETDLSMDEAIRIAESLQ